MSSSNGVNDRKGTTVWDWCCGLRSLGEELGEELLSNGASIAISENDPGRLQIIAAQYPEAKTYGSFSEILVDPGVEGVALATPAEQHFAMAAAV